MLHERGLHHSGFLAGGRPERDGHRVMWLGFSGRHLVEQPGRVQAEVIVELDANGHHGVGGDVAIGSWLADDDPGRLVLEHADVVTDRVAIAETLGILECEPERHVLLDRETRLKAGSCRVERDAAGCRIVSHVKFGGDQDSCWPGHRARSACLPGRGMRSSPRPESGWECPCTWARLAGW